MLVGMVVTLTLIAALCNAIAAILQRRAVGAPEPHELFSKALVTAVSKNRLWLMGFGLQITAGILEVVALYRGTLILVEPLLVTDLVFLLLILHFRFGMKSGPREWFGIVAICIGLSIFLVVANPVGGKMQYSGLVWTITGSVLAPLIILGIVTTRRIKTPSLRAGIGALTAGISFGFSAALVKLVLEQVQQGVGVALTGWALYAALISAAIAIIASQSAYGAGPIAVTQPVIEISSPMVSVILGISIFDEHIDTAALALIAEILGTALAILGIIIVGTSKRIITAENQGKLLAPRKHLVR
jgi:hypothetical protein